MFNNIEIMEINKKEVMKSTWVSFIMVFIILFIVPVSNGELGNAIAVPVAGLVLGAPAYFPTIIIALLMERLFIREKSTKWTIVILFIIEALIASSTTVMVYELEKVEFLPILGGYSVALLVRWIYLLRKGRIYNQINSNI